jgi:hypothetical protein
MYITRPQNKHGTIQDGDFPGRNRSAPLSNTWKSLGGWGFPNHFPLTQHIRGSRLNIAGPIRAVCVATDLLSAKSLSAQFISLRTSIAEEDWEQVVDEFAATFGLDRRTVGETSRYYCLLRAEVHLNRTLFGSIVRMITVLSQPGG